MTTRALALAAACAIASLPLFGEIKAGDPVSKMIEELGEPGGKFEIGGQWRYSYDGGAITVKDGVVVKVPADFYLRAQREAARKERIDEKRAQGLVNHKGKWMTPQEAQAEQQAAALRAQQRKEKRAQERRERVAVGRFKVHEPEAGDEEWDMEDVFQYGSPNIFIFVRKAWRGREQYKNAIKQMASMRPDLIFHYVELQSRECETAKQYDIEDMPCAYFYDSGRREIRDWVVGGEEIAAAFEEEFKQ